MDIDIENGNLSITTKNQIYTFEIKEKKVRNEVLLIIIKSILESQTICQACKKEVFTIKYYFYFHMLIFYFISIVKGN